MGVECQIQIATTKEVKRSVKDFLMTMTMTIIIITMTKALELATEGLRFPVTPSSPSLRVAVICKTFTKLLHDQVAKLIF